MVEQLGKVRMKGGPVALTYQLHQCIGPADSKASPRVFQGPITCVSGCRYQEKLSRARVARS